MGAFEYLSVLISIILALGMTRVLAGVGERLQARSQRRVYWVQAVWIVNLFLYLVIAWWIFYRWRDQQPWTCDARYKIDYKAHYYANHRAFFILFGLFTPVDIVDSLLKGVPHFLALGPAYFISSSLYFAGLITAAITRNERYHEFYAVFFFLQTVVMSFLIFQTLV